MGGVDNSDKSIHHLSVSRATRKYWKIFSNLVDITLLDSYILYSLNLLDNSMSRQDFHTSIEEDLVGEDVPNIAQNIVDNANKLEHLPGQRDRLCHRYQCKTEKSYYWCPGCNCGIHPLCYHKLEHFWRPTWVARKRRVSTSDSDYAYLEVSFWAITFFCT